MLRINTIAVVFAVASGAVGLISASAWAAPAEWMLSKKTLAQEGLTTAALSTTGALDKNGVLSGANLTVECSGGEALTSPEIVKSRGGKAKNLVATGCVSLTQNCGVPVTIGVVPVEIEVTLDGVLAVKGVIKPQSGTLLTTIVVSGGACGVEGKHLLTGDIEVLAPEGQDERTDQLFETNQAATGLLKLDGSISASATGAVFLLLASRAAWSFL